MIKAKLVAQWKNPHDKHTYRLSTRGQFRDHYTDFYILERKGVDALGDPSWSLIVEFPVAGKLSEVATVLAAGICAKAPSKLTDWT